MTYNRKHLATISLSATALVALLLHEGYRENAYLPLAGDVPTIGFGTTSGVKLGDLQVRVYKHFLCILRAIVKLPAQ